MTWPTFLYELKPRDQQITPLELYQEQSSQNHAGATLGITLRIVPQERVLIITEILMRGFADNVARTYDRGELVYQVAGLGVQHILFDRNVLAETGGQRGAQDILLPNALMVPPQTQFQATFEYSAAAAGTHRSVVAVRGLLVPRGNFAF